MDQQIFVEMVMKMMMRIVIIVKKIWDVKSDLVVKIKSFGLGA